MSVDSQKIMLDEIKRLCPKAENITITPDGTVGMKVGMFSQAVGLNFNKENSTWQAKVVELYEDLKGMNRQVEHQQDVARKAR